MPHADEPSPPTNSTAIGPTAHYTGHVWARNDMGSRRLNTLQGSLLFHGLQPVMALSRRAGGPTLEALLLARHRIIDHLLTQEIEAGRIDRVVEIAAGMSPRGLRYARRYGAALDYLETDLPAMAERKRAALAPLASLGAHHSVHELDALQSEGSGSLTSLLQELPRGRGTAVITEGLLNYLPPPSVQALWHNVATGLRREAHGLYLTDLHMKRENSDMTARAFTAGLGIFVRGSTHLHFRDGQAATSELRRAGFSEATVHAPADYTHLLAGMQRTGAERVRVLVATTNHERQD